MSARQVLLPRRIDPSIAQGFGFVGPARKRRHTLGLAVVLAGCCTLAGCEPREVDWLQDAAADRGGPGADAAVPEIPGLLALRVSPRWSRSPMTV